MHPARLAADVVRNVVRDIVQIRRVPCAGQHRLRELLAHRSCRAIGSAQLPVRTSAGSAADPAFQAAHPVREYHPLGTPPRTSKHSASNAKVVSASPSSATHVLGGPQGQLEKSRRGRTSSRTSVITTLARQAARTLASKEAIACDAPPHREIDQPAGVGPTARSVLRHDHRPRRSRR